MVGCRHCSLLLLYRWLHTCCPYSATAHRAHRMLCLPITGPRPAPVLTGHQQRPHSVEVIRDGRPQKDIIATTITQTDDDTCTWAGLGVDRGASSASD